MEPSLPGPDVDSLASLIRERAASRAGAPYLLDARSSRVVTYASLEGHIAAREHSFVAGDSSEASASGLRSAIR